MCKEIICRKKVIKQFLSKNKTGAPRILFVFDLFFNLIFVHVFVVKLINITSSDKNRNMHIIYKKNPEVELHSFKTFFSGLVQIFAIFSCKMSDF